MSFRERHFHAIQYWFIVRFSTRSAAFQRLCTFSGLFATSWADTAFARSSAATLVMWVSILRWFLRKALVPVLRVAPPLPCPPPMNSPFWDLPLPLPWPIPRGEARRGEEEGRR